MTRRLRLGGAEQLVEPVEAGIPSGCALSDPLAGLFEAGGAGADEVFAAVALALNEPGALEHAQMTRDSRQGNAKGLGQCGNAAFPMLGKMVNNPPASRVREGREDRRNLFLMVNHGVKCRTERFACQGNS